MYENIWGMSCNGITWECPDCGAQNGFGNHVLPAVRESVRAAEFGAFRRTLYEHCPGHGITQDYEQIVNHILAGEKGV